MGIVSLLDGKEMEKRKERFSTTNITKSTNKENYIVFKNETPDAFFSGPNGTEFQLYGVN
ncbi:MAG: hypothetical protein JXR56_07085 [Candidatus Cloacimonetes bacterium]|nr:hypothetical protein [Candidatus Cloacimonadota bacterium]